MKVLCLPLLFIILFPSPTFATKRACLKVPNKRKNTLSLALSESSQKKPRHTPSSPECRSHSYSPPSSRIDSKDDFSDFLNGIENTIESIQEIQTLLLNLNTDPSTSSTDCTTLSTHHDETISEDDVSLPVLEAYYKDKDPKAIPETVLAARQLSGILRDVAKAILNSNIEIQLYSSDDGTEAHALPNQQEPIKIAFNIKGKIFNILRSSRKGNRQLLTYRELSNLVSIFTYELTKAQVSKETSVLDTQFAEKHKSFLEKFYKLKPIELQNYRNRLLLPKSP